jgi:sulfur carrier protein ThiS
MHRGSSKVGGENPPPADNLPLSAPSLLIEVEVARAGRSHVFQVEVAVGTSVREVVRQVGQSPEGAVVLLDETPIPLDQSLDRALRLTVVPTFSGG